MRTRRMERRDAALRVLGLAATLIAITVSCSVANVEGPGAGVGEDGGFQVPPDSGVGESSGGGSSGGGSSGSGSGGQGADAGADAGAAVSLPTSILAVHASANLYDFRLCFGFAGGGPILPFPAYPDDPTHPMPETNYPGVPVGGAALLPTIALPNAPLAVYVIPAYYLQSQGYVAGANEPTCDDLILNVLDKQNVEYFTIPAVTLPPGGGAVVIAIEGCAAGMGVAAGSVAQCGASFSATTGNLSALAGALVSSPDDAGAWTMQLAELSPSFGEEAGTGAALTYIDPTIDASIPLAAPESSISASSVTVPLDEAGVSSAYFVIGPSSSTPVAESLASIEYFQSPSSNPFTYFSARAAYFVAIVGDATDAAAPASLPDGAPNPAFDGHGLHVIAYPEN
jgi:hypothetical protein